MCIFIAGIQPKTRTLGTAPQRCPQCGLYQAYTQQIDHYLSLFFIPLLRVKQGEAFLYCRRCERQVGPNAQPSTGSASFDRRSLKCRQCGGDLDAHFQFCPHCGRRR